MPMQRPPLPRTPAITPAAAKAQSKLAQLRKGDPMTDAFWPRPNERIPLKVRSLSNEEVVECYAAAIAFFESKGVQCEQYGALVTDAFEQEVSTQLLHRACRDAKDPRNTFAEDEADLRSNTTPDERAAMVDVYRDHRQSVDPNFGDLTPEMGREIVEAIKKKDTRRLRGFGSSVLATFLLTMESPPSSSPTGSVDTSQS